MVAVPLGKKWGRNGDETKLLVGVWGQVVEVVELVCISSVLFFFWNQLQIASYPL